MVLGVVAGDALGLTPLVFLRGRRLLRAHDGHLRRGQLAAPRARRRLHLRPLCLRRALELRGRLGDPARLPDRDGHRRGGDHRLPRRVLDRPRRRPRGDRDRRRWRSPSWRSRTCAACRPSGSAWCCACRCSDSGCWCVVAAIAFAQDCDPGAITDSIELGSAPAWDDAALRDGGGRRGPDRGRGGLRAGRRGARGPARPAPRGARRCAASRCCCSWACPPPR